MLTSNTDSLIFPSKTKMLILSKDCLQAKESGVPCYIKGIAGINSPYLWTVYQRTPASLSLGLFITYQLPKAKDWDSESVRGQLKQEMTHLHCFSNSSFQTWRSAGISGMQYPTVEWFKGGLTMDLDCKFGSSLMEDPYLRSFHHSCRKSHISHYLSGTRWPRLFPSLKAEDSTWLAQENGALVKTQR